MNRGVQEVEVTSDCVPNIGARGRRSRVVFGIVWSGITISVFALLSSGNARPLAYLLIAPLATYAAVFFFQAKEKT